MTDEVLRTWDDEIRIVSGSLQIDKSADAHWPLDGRVALSWSKQRDLSPTASYDVQHREAP